MLLSYDPVNHRATALDSLDLLLQTDRLFLHVKRISREDYIVQENILLKNQQPILFSAIFFVECKHRFGRTMCLLGFGAEVTAMILVDVSKPTTTSGPFDKDSPIFVSSFLAHRCRPKIWILDTHFGTDMVPRPEIIAMLHTLNELDVKFPVLLWELWVNLDDMGVSLGTKE
jgi:hypothetical protein